MFKKLLIAIAILLSIPAHSENILLKADNTVLIDTDINSKSVLDAIQKIQALNKLDSKEAIYLVLNTPGGSVPAGVDFIRFAKSSQRPIHTITIYAASMGFLIVQNLPGTRFIVEGGVLMSHRVSIDGIGGQLPGELESRVGYIKESSEDLDRAVAKRAKMTLKAYQALVHDEYYATPDKALKDHFADSKAMVSCGETLNTTHSRTEKGPFGNVELTFSDCPLITSPVDIK